LIDWMLLILLILLSCQKKALCEPSCNTKVRFSRMNQETHYSFSQCWVKAD